MRGILGRLTYSNVMSTIAVVIAIGGGTAYAANWLGKNTVKSRNIAPGAVRSPDIAKNAVKRLKIAPGAVSGSRIAPGAVDTGKLAVGAVTADRIAGESVEEPKLNPAVKAKVNTVQRGQLVRISAHNGNASTAPEHNLISRAPFRVYAKCYSIGAVLYGQVFVATTQPGAIATGTSTNLTGQAAYLDPDTPEGQRRFVSAVYNQATAAAAAGSATLIHGSNAFQVGVTGAIRGDSVTLPAGDANYGGNEARCVFGSYLIAVSG